MRSITTLDHDDARAAIEAIREELVRRGKLGVIAVADAHGETLGLLRMSGAALSSIAVATNKAFTAARLRRPSRAIGRNARHPDTGFDIGFYGDPRYVGWGGGLPVVVAGAVAGAVAVSGLSQDEDEELAALGVAAIEAAASRTDSTRS
jgi:glc operon protein GlcG